MRYVILRDDDTNALTPVATLERLYRPFLDRRLPVNLAVIPEVRTDARRPDGKREGFLPLDHATRAGTVRMEENPNLVDYLRLNAGYHIAQHGCFHDCYEFDKLEWPAALRLVELGAQRLREAGFPPARAFVAPHDRISRAGLLAVARRFSVFSTGWFELGRVPAAWLGHYLGKKLRRAPHWRVDGLTLLSHPGCLLSCALPAEQILAAVRRQVAAQRLTVLVTHGWEYFRDGMPDEPLIAALHATAAWLAAERDVRVISFAELADGSVPLG